MLCASCLLSLSKSFFLFFLFFHLIFSFCASPSLFPFFPCYFIFSLFFLFFPLFFLYFIFLFDYFYTPSLFTSFFVLIFFLPLFLSLFTSFLHSILPSLPLTLPLYHTFTLPPSMLGLVSYIEEDNGKLRRVGGFTHLNLFHFLGKMLGKALYEVRTCERSHHTPHCLFIYIHSLPELSTNLSLHLI